MSSDQGQRTLDRLMVFLGAIGTLTAIIAATTTDRTSFMIALLLIAAAAISMRLVYIWRARTTDGGIRYPHLRGGLALAVTFLLLMCLDGLTTPPSRDYFLHTILGYPDIRRDVLITNVSIARSDTAYRVEATLFNRANKKLMANRMELILQAKKDNPSPRPSFGSLNGCNNGSLCSAGGDPAYALIEEMKVGLGGVGTAAIRGAVAVVDEAGKPDDFVREVEGTAVCNKGPILTLKLPADVPLEPGSFSRTTIRIPKKFAIDSGPEVLGAEDFMGVALTVLDEPAATRSYAGLAEYTVTVFVGPDSIPIRRTTAFRVEGATTNPWGW
ncbi:hypothetical protein ABT352_34875 [Streptosporangium sp. NPDC000563]|uniref:hypothetical protein n=1 Tax=Streptosporangium sp. NPDC000563 TaxID=3154366 RepID=UPI0033323D4A